MMSESLHEESVPDAKGEDSTRVVMKLHPALAPIKVAVLPLLKNREELVKASTDVFNKLKFSFQCQYDEKDAVGRRYRRQDAIGTPYCVTIDHETLENGTVTIRERDSMLQERIAIGDIARIVSEKVDMAKIL